MPPSTPFKGVPPLWGGVEILCYSHACMTATGLSVYILVIRSLGPFWGHTGNRSLGPFWGPQRHAQAAPQSSATAVTTQQRAAGACPDH